MSALKFCSLEAFYVMTYFTVDNLCILFDHNKIKDVLQGGKGSKIYRNIYLPKRSITILLNIENFVKMFSKFLVRVLKRKVKESTSRVRKVLTMMYTRQK